MRCVGEVDQSFYSSQFGRFLSADRFAQAAKANDSGSWNKYSYTRGDPVNRFDQNGTCDSDTDTSVNVCDSTEDSDYAGDSQKGQRRPVNPSNVSVTNLAKSGKKYDQVTSTFDKITSSIDSDCLSFLQSGGEDLSQYVRDLIGNNLLGVANVGTNTIAAFTGTGGTTLNAGDAAIVVNLNGAFFNSSFTLDQGAIQGGTTKADIFILLHELGHALGANPDISQELGEKPFNMA